MCTQTLTPKKEETEDAQLNDQQGDEEPDDEDSETTNSMNSSSEEFKKDEIFEFLVNRQQKQSKQKYTATDETFIWIAYVYEKMEKVTLGYSLSKKFR